MDVNAIPFPVAAAAQGADVTNLLQRVTFTGFDTLPLFDIRNGQVADATSILVRPTIPASCYWAPVGGVSFSDCIRCVDGFIRTAWAQSFQMAPANEPEAKKRKKAIILGVARAVMTISSEAP